MRFGRTLLLLAVLMMIPVLACAQTIPEDALHEAVMTLTYERDDGECWVEGHVILGESDKGDTHEVYAYVFYQNYGFMDGVFTDVGGGSIGPRTFIFDKTADGGYALRETIAPLDGTDYTKSISEMMPAECVQKLESGFVDRAELVRQQHEQAQRYLDSIGRTEPIQDWRERDLQLADMLVYASNQIISLSPPWPLWVTSVERIEDGERYVYTRSWYPDPAANAQAATDGVPGTQVLTKMRHADNAVLESIIIEAVADTLTVTMRDDGGTRTYVFAYDGETYHQPTVTEEGACGVTYEAFDRYAGFLPE